MHCVKACLCKKAWWQKSKVEERSQVEDPSPMKQLEIAKSYCLSFCREAAWVTTTLARAR